MEKHKVYILLYKVVCIHTLGEVGNFVPHC